MELYIWCPGIRRRRKIEAGDRHIIQLISRKRRLGRDVHSLTARVAAIAVLHPWNNLSSHYDSKEHQQGAAPGGAQRHPAAQPAKGTPMFLDRRRGKIVEGLGKLATALREQNTGSIKLVGGPHRCNHGFLKMVLFGKLRGARSAIRDMRFNLFAFLVADFIAGIENQKRGNLSAPNVLFKHFLPNPPNSYRTLPFAPIP